MKRFLKEMIGIMGLTIFISSQSLAFAAEKIQQNESTSVYSGINIVVLSVRERSNGNRLAEFEWNLVLHDTEWFYGDRLVCSWK